MSTSYVVQRNGGSITVALPIKTVSEANQREHWAKKHKRKVAQQAIAVPIFRSAIKHPITLPLTVTFVRVSCNKMDSDNLAGSCKHVRDALARILGIDDGDELLTFVYQQRKAAHRHEACIEVSLLSGQGGLGDA